MARTTITRTTPCGSYPSLPLAANAADLTMTAADIVNQNQAVASGNDLVIAHNTGGSAYTVTMTSAPDEKGRTGHISAYSLGAGEYAVFGPFKAEGWKQSDSYLYFEANNAAVKFGVVPLP